MVLFESEVFKSLPQPPPQNSEDVLAPVEQSASRETPKPGQMLAEAEQAATAKEKGAQRIVVAQEKLKAQQEQLKNLELYPRVAMLADRNLIENQEVNFIQITSADDELGEGSIRVQLKLTGEHWEKIANKMNEQLMYEAEEKQLAVELISYGSYTMSTCIAEDIDGVKLRVATGLDSTKSHRRSALGLIEIIIPKEKVGSPEQIYQIVNDILTQKLDIPDGLAVPPREAENAYKQARYAWHHKLDQAPEGIEDKLVRTEVAPSCFTFVEPGKHKEYQAWSPYALYHSVEEENIASLPKIFQAGGILSTHERYRRGLKVAGMSSNKDLETGGADSVFARMVNKAVLYRVQNVNIVNYINLILKPAILDRTDWFAYTEDAYGSTDESEFKKRLTPTDFMNQNATSWRSENEIMFRTAISARDIEYIACRDQQSMMKVYAALSQAGITEINGQPLNKVIKLLKTYGEAVDISNDQDYQDTIMFEQALAEGVTRQREIADHLLKEFNQVSGWLKTAGDILHSKNSQQEYPDAAVAVAYIRQNDYYFDTEELLPEYLTQSQRDDLSEVLTACRKMIHQLAAWFSNQAHYDALIKFGSRFGQYPSESYTRALRWLDKILTTIGDPIANSKSIIPEATPADQVPAAAA